MSEFFFNLTPEFMLEAVEEIGKRSTGRCFALNSLENRVYEVEMEDGSRVVGKFYRPGRWSRETILEEHQFLKDLAEAEIPVVAPLTLKNGQTLGVSAVKAATAKPGASPTHGAVGATSATSSSGPSPAHSTSSSSSAEGDQIYFAVFPKARGRAPEELNDDQLAQLGRFLGRIHNVGAQKKAPHRLEMNPENFGRQPLKFLLENNFIPMELMSRYKMVAEAILDTITPWFENLKTHRIHGDCHMGNLLFDLSHRKNEAFFLDFDDMMTGPAVQDFWLLVPGHDEQARRDRELFIKGYREMREFDSSTLRLIEPLRSLRIINYSAWIAKRWQDPAFQRIFTEFTSHRYWESEIQDLSKQLDLIRSGEVLH